VVDNNRLKWFLSTIRMGGNRSVLKQKLSRQTFQVFKTWKVFIAENFKNDRSSLKNFAVTYF
jgi:hypothetical protein